MLVERKICFISDASDWGVVLGIECAGHRFKGRLPLHGQPVGQEFHRQKERATHRNSTVSYDSHLQIGQRWPDQHHLGCF